MRLPLLLVCLSQAVLAAETMRIAVGPESSRVVLEGDALRVGADADDASFEAFSSGKVALSLLGDQLLADGVAAPTRALRFRSGEMGEGVISVNGTRVKGDVVVLFGKTQLAAVNVIPLEDYLVGVI